MRNFEGIKAEAEAYYKTPEYLEGVEIIRAIFAQIRGKVFAFDLDGTLVDGVEASGVEDSVLLRPYANEILQIVAESRNRVILWTGASLARVRHAESSSGLVLPKDTKIIAREDNANMVAGACHRASEGVVFNAEDCAWEDFCLGLVKIPLLFGVDFLFDDFVDWHKKRGKKVMSPYNDDDKFIKVPPFNLNTMAHPSVHSRDFGLLAASMDAGEACEASIDRSLLERFQQRFLDKNNDYLGLRFRLARLLRAYR